MGTVLLAVFLHHPAQHLSTAVVVEVGIDIGEVHTVGVQEALKQQVVFQRIDFRDAQTVGHHRTGSGSTTRSHPHAELLAGGVDEVLHDKEVAGETHGLHHVELKVDMLLHVVGQRVTIEPSRPVVGKLGQIVGLKLDAVDLVVATETVDDGLPLLGIERMLAILVGSKLFVEVFFGEFLTPFFFRAEAFGYGEEGHDGTVVDAVDLHFVKNFQRVAQCLGDILEDIVHFGLRLKPLLLAVAHAVGVVEILACGQTEQVVVGFGGLLVLKVDVVGADHLDAILLGKLQQHLVGLLLQGVGLAVGQYGGILHLMALQLQIVVVAKHPVIPLAGLTGSFDVALDDLRGHLAGNAGRADDEILMVFLQVGAVGAWTVVVAVYPGPRDQFDEVFVPMIVLGQHDEMIAGVVAVLLHLVLLTVAGNVHLAAKDGLEGLLSVFLSVFVDFGTIVRKLLDAVHHAVVGDGHTPHTVADGLVHQVVDARLSVENREMGVNV